MKENRTETQVTIYVDARITEPASKSSNSKQTTPEPCKGQCQTCPGGCRNAAEPTAPDGSHTRNSLRQAGEILLKMAAGQYPTVEEKDLWETLDSLLRSYAAGKGAAHE